ncbi:MAG: hypothetical protein DMG65_26770 [Candidatus Angelobacter sp. Gp1-AA117]|nr:MAG: hypothetical protein DMG65_26770 [Candidatus Angelobacter sp. Gp1-AA117]
MKSALLLGTLMTLGAVLLLVLRPAPAAAGTDAISGDFKVLAPISHGSLTIFPVVATKVHDTSGFLTLDEGIRSGDVTVTEVGKINSMLRRGHTMPLQSGAQVNRLVLVNNSKLPLILLAGEVVTGGQQDRVVGKDRLVPPESDPVDLSVFCVEHGRWTESAPKFSTNGSVMVQPSVRKQAMVAKDQQKVWDEVSRSQGGLADMVAASPGVTAGAPAGQNANDITVRELHSTTSYAKVRNNQAVKQQVDSITEPMQKSFESVIKQLRDQNAVGVVVAVKGKIIWADIFASNSLLSKYWPKLLQSYAAEALTFTGDHDEVTMKAAQTFVEDWQARHEVVESEPGLYRQSEKTGDKFRAFELTSLLPKQNFNVHISKMSE